MTNLFFSFLLACILPLSFTPDIKNDSGSFIYNYQNRNMNLEWDLLDVYQLTIGKTFLYGNYENFINEIGLPSKVTITKTEYLINSKLDLDKVIRLAKDPNIVTLHYPGIEMWFTYNNSIIPSSIDFRKTEKSITYGATTFDKTYNIEQFKKQFPNSANPLFTFPQSLFEIETKEKGANYKHYILIRKSKDNPNTTPMIEFTFDNDKLVFILFANFG